MDEQSSILSKASPTLAGLLDKFATKVSLRAGEVLFQEGQSSDAVFTLTAGRLEVSVLSADGRKLVLDIVRPGALVGEIALFDPGTRTATLTAIEPSKLLRLKNTDILAEIRISHELAIDMIGFAGRRMR